MTNYYKVTLEFRSRTTGLEKPNLITVVTGNTMDEVAENTRIYLKMFTGNCFYYDDRHSYFEADGDIRYGYLLTECEYIPTLG